MNRPAISVCIANFNGMAVIDDCIRSVQAQIGAACAEIIIHDDASTDASRQHIRLAYPGVRLIESPENRGFCVANNRMVAAAQGEYILLLNNDAALFPDALQTLHRAALEMGRPAILGLPQYDADSGILLDRGSLLDPFLNPVPNRDPKRRDVGMIMGACLWLPKSLWQELGGFPEWFDSIGEDLYLCSIARLGGHPVRVLPTSGYRHRVGASFGGGKVTGGTLVTTFQRRALSERNKTFVLAMTYPWPFMQVLLAVHLLLLLLEGLLLSVLRRRTDFLTSIYLPAVLALPRNRARLRAGRRAAMARRRVTARGYFSVFQGMPHKLRMLWRHGLPELR